MAMAKKGTKLPVQDAIAGLQAILDSHFGGAVVSLLQGNNIQIKFFNDRATHEFLTYMHRHFEWQGAQKLFGKSVNGADGYVFSADAVCYNPGIFSEFVEGASTFRFENMKPDTTMPPSGNHPDDNLKPSGDSPKQLKLF